MKITATESISDWYQNVSYDIDPKQYDYFTLEAEGTSMCWTLKCFKNINPKGFAKYQEYKRYSLTPHQNIRNILKELYIKEIKENCYLHISKIIY